MLILSYVTVNGFPVLRCTGDKRITELLQLILLSEGFEADHIEDTATYVLTDAPSFVVMLAVSMIY